jgi:hypothetical protein
MLAWLNGQADVLKVLRDDAFLLAGKDLPQRLTNQ